VAPPVRQAEFDILYSEGISKEGNLLDVGLELGIIKKSGAFYSFGDIRLGQGRENAREFLRQNPEHAASIERQIREQTGAGRAAPAVLAADNGRAVPNEPDDLLALTDQPPF
jgi:recombination protein RecA